jgi:murein L,D-transpeptidase YcbB/YkuD
MSKVILELDHQGIVTDAEKLITDAVGSLRRDAAISDTASEGWLKNRKEGIDAGKSAEGKVLHQLKRMGAAGELVSYREVQQMTHLKKSDLLMAVENLLAMESPHIQIVMGDPRKAGGVRQTFIRLMEHAP